MDNGLGYVRLYRKIADNPVWTTLQPAVLKVMLGFLLKANWRQTTWYDGRAQMEIPRGAFITSYAKMAEFCNLSMKKTRLAFGHLEKLEFAAYTRASNWTVVTVLNYDCYQSAVGDEGSPLGTPPGSLPAGTRQGEGKIWATAKEVKKLRTKTRSSTSDRSDFSVDNSPFDTLDEQPRGDTRWGLAEKKRAFYEKFWPMWPKKVARAAAEKAWCREVTLPEEAEKIINALRAQIPQLTTDLKYCPYPATWLNQKRYEDEIEEDQGQGSASEPGSLYTPAEDDE